MKLTLTTITVFSIIAMHASGVNATPAGRVQHTQNVSTKGQTNSASKINQSVKQLDLPLLAKTGTAFFQSNRYQSESQMVIGGRNQGVEFTAYAQIKTLVQSDKKFRSEITFKQPGKQSKLSALVISNGKQVSIYRPDLQQYAVTSYKAFEKSDDSFLIGLSSSFFLQIPEDTRQVIASGELLNNNLLQEIGLNNNQQLTADKRIVEGEELYVYKYTEPKAGIIFSTFVQPETAILKQLQLTTKVEGLDVVVTEKILSRTQNPTITQQTFNFSPPKGAKRVKSLSISPF